MFEALVITSLALLLTLILASLLLLVHIKIFSKQNRFSNQNLPLGDMGSLPFLGETLGFLKPHNSNSLGPFLQDHCFRYGRVFKSHLFGSRAIVSCDFELNTFILQNEEKLFLTSYPKCIHGILGKNSLLVVTGDLHKKLRSVIVSFIGSSKSRPKFLECVDKLLLSMMNSWSGHREIAFFKEAKKFTLTLMVKHVLSIEPNDKKGSQIFQDFETYMKGFVSLPIYFPGTSYFKAVKARERLSSTVKEIIRERQEAQNLYHHHHHNNNSNNNNNNNNNNKHHDVGPTECDEEEEGDFLDVIMKKKEVSEEEKVSVVLDLLLGGYDTTATLMALIVYFISRAPLVFHKLKEEHQSIREKKRDNESLNWEDYKKMEFTYHVTCEAMRCGNVVKFVHRKALQDVKFKDIFIPSGWKVLPIFTGVHFDQSLHDKPFEFNPWRWEDKEMRKKVTPFGGGPRLCPGADLAKVVIGFFIHHFVLNYRWKTKEDDSPLAYPYVEFGKGLVLEIEPFEPKDRTICTEEIII